MTKQQQTVQQHHFYATTVIAWAVGATRAEAIRKALNSSRGMFKPNDEGGIYVYSVRVGLPQSAEYEIDNYMPQNVPLSDKLEGTMKATKGAIIHCSKVTD